MHGNASHEGRGCCVGTSQSMLKEIGMRWVKSRGGGEGGELKNKKKEMVEKEKVTLRCTSKKSGKPLEGEKNTETKTHAKEVDRSVYAG